MSELKEGPPTTQNTTSEPSTSSVPDLNSSTNLFNGEAAPPPPVVQSGSDYADPVPTGQA